MSMGFVSNCHGARTGIVLSSLLGQLCSSSLLLFSCGSTRVAQRALAPTTVTSTATFPGINMSGGKKMKSASTQKDARMLRGIALLLVSIIAFSKVEGGAAAPFGGNNETLSVADARIKYQPPDAWTRYTAQVPGGSEFVRARELGLDGRQVRASASLTFQGECSCPLHIRDQ